MVDPPWATLRFMTLFKAARAMPFGDTPQCLKKSLSSMDITAFCRSTGISFRGVSVRRSVKSSVTRLPLQSKIFVTRLGV